MLKQEYLKNVMSEISKKQDLRLYARRESDGLFLRLLVPHKHHDLLLNTNQKDSGYEVYETTISPLDRQNLRLLRLVQGVSGLFEHLRNSENWRSGEEKDRLLILYNRKQIKQVKLKLNKCFSIFDFNDIVSFCGSDQKESKKEICYIQGKTILLQKSENSSLKSREEFEQMISERVEKKRTEKQEAENARLMEERDRKIKETKKFRQKIDINCKWISSFTFAGDKISKKVGENNERHLMGAQIIGRSSTFTFNIKLDKLSSEARNPVFWAGFMKKDEDQVGKILDMKNVIAMSDKRRICNNGKFQLMDILIDECINGPKHIIQGDQIKVQINFSKKKVTWTKNGDPKETPELGSTQISLNQNEAVSWVPFIYLYHGGDSIVWEGVF